MSKTIIAVKHFGLGGRESLETAVKSLFISFKFHFVVWLFFYAFQRLFKKSLSGG